MYPTWGLLSNTNFEAALRASPLSNACSHPPMWCHPEALEDPAQPSIPCLQHQDTRGQWKLGSLFQWSLCNVELRQRCKLICQKASREDQHRRWRCGELQVGNQVYPHQGSHPEKVRNIKVDLQKILTLEQHGPGLVSTSCMSFKDTSSITGV